MTSSKPVSVRAWVIVSPEGRILPEHCSPIKERTEEDLREWLMNRDGYSMVKVKITPIPKQRKVKKP